MAKEGRQRIVASAFRLFLNKGYEGVKLQDIINETLLSKGAIYHHFKSKYDIYLATLEEYYFDLMSTAHEEDQHLHFQERIKKRFSFFAQLITTLENMNVAFPIRAFFMFQLESEKDDKLRLRITESMYRYRDSFKSILLTAQAKNEVNPQLNIPVVALQLMSLLEGIAIHHSTIESDCGPFLMKQYDTVIVEYLKTLS